MKTKFRALRFRHFLLTGSIAMLLLPAVGSATILYWDGPGTTANSVVDGGTGTWNTSTTNWTNITGSANQAWTNGNDAVFQGAAGLVTLGSGISATSLTFNTAGYGVVASSTLTLSGASAAINNNTTGTISFSATAATSLVIPNSPNGLAINNAVASSGVSFVGSTNNNYSFSGSGPITVNRGTLSMSGGGSGTPAIINLISGNVTLNSAAFLNAALTSNSASTANYNVAYGSGSKLSFSGQSEIFTTRASGVTRRTVVGDPSAAANSTLVRNNRGTLVVTATGGVVEWGSVAAGGGSSALGSGVVNLSATLDSTTQVTLLTINGGVTSHTVTNSTGGSGNVLTSMVDASIVGRQADANRSGEFLVYGNLRYFSTTSTSANAGTFGAINYTNISGTQFNGATPGIGDTVYTTTGNLTLSGNSDAFALKVANHTVDLGGFTLNLGANDGAKSAGLILNGGGISNGTLAFGASEGIIYTSGANASISAAITGSNGLTTQGIGKLTVSATNNYTGPTTVNGGTLEVSGSIGNSTSVSVTGGTLLLSGAVSSPKLSSSASVALGGGAQIKLSDTPSSSFNESVGALSLSGASSIDFGTFGSGNSFRFADSHSSVWTGATLSIYNWTQGVDHLFFGEDLGSNALTSTQLGQITFYGGGQASGSLGTAAFLSGSSGELTLAEVPEPSTLALVAGVLGLVGFRERRRCVRLLRG